MSRLPSRHHARIPALALLALLATPAIAGTPIDLLRMPKGCPFAPRCEHCMKVCLTEKPPYFELEPGHYSACWLQYDRKER